MGARYSDRFFGPDGVAGQRGLAGQETVDLVEGVDIGSSPAGDVPERLETPEAPRPWHANVAARTALVVALLAGVGGGAYGWDKWRDHETDVRARSAIDLTSTASLDSVSPEMSQLALTLHLQNDGPYPVTVTDIAPLDPRLTPVTDGWEPISLDSGEDILRFLNFAIDCKQEADPSLSPRTAEALLATLRTIDDQRHEEQLGVMGVGYYGGSLGQLLNDQCAFQEQRASYSTLYGEIGQVQLYGEDAVTSTILLTDPYSGSPAQSAVTVEVTAAGSAFATVLLLPEPGAPDVLHGVDVRWTVNDCAAALAATESDMTVVFRGTTPSDESVTATTVWPSPSLAAALARLSERVC